jgi:hypothetical protein
MYHHKDFEVFPYTTSARPELEQWQIRTGKVDIVSTYRDYDKAVADCEQLNLDPWYFYRIQPATTY